MSKYKEKGNHERWISIITVGASIIALFFSWQANKRASQQATPQILVLDTTWNGGGYHSIESGQQATCKHIVRLTNLGGISTAITGYRVGIFLQQNEISNALEFESSFSTIIKPDRLTPNIRNFEIYLLLNTSQVDVPNPFDNKDVLELPYRIEPYSTFDIQTAVNFSYDANLKLESPRYNDPGSSYYAPSVLEGYTPITLVYVFETANGQVIMSPTVACWYIK
ncbi:MAG: hypothetical protein HZB19_05760 [Chloroflexi bacterium]|nr:hypothetical protein [Chloroflexota bacterium]